MSRTLVASTPCRKNRERAVSARVSAAAERGFLTPAMFLFSRALRCGGCVSLGGRVIAARSFLLDYSDICVGVRAIARDQPWWIILVNGPSPDVSCVGATR